MCQLHQSAGEARLWLQQNAPELPPIAAHMLSELFPVREVEDQHQYLVRIENSMGVSHREAGVIYLLYLWPSTPEKQLVLCVRHGGRAFRVMRPISELGKFLESVGALPASVRRELEKKAPAPIKSVG